MKDPHIWFAELTGYTGNIGQDRSHLQDLRIYAADPFAILGKLRVQLQNGGISDKFPFVWKPRQDF